MKGAQGERDPRDRMGISGPIVTLLAVVVYAVTFFSVSHLVTIPEVGSAAGFAAGAAIGLVPALVVHYVCPRVVASLAKLQVLPPDRT